MRLFLRLLLAVSLLPLFPGCNAIRERRAALAAPPSARGLPLPGKQIAGVYTGAVRSTSRSFGMTGITAAEIRIEVGGTPEAPQVFLTMNSSCTSAWNASESYTEAFTNIPERKFGTKGRLRVGRATAGGLVICLQPEIFSPNRGAALILVPRGRGELDVEYLGHFGRRGVGILYRMPDFSSAR